MICPAQQSATTLSPGLFTETQIRFPGESLFVYSTLRQAEVTMKDENGNTHWEGPVSQLNSWANGGGL